jgi:hypothetical protein
MMLPTARQLQRHVRGRPFRSGADRPPAARVLRCTDAARPHTDRCFAHNLMPVAISVAHRATGPARSGRRDALIYADAWWPMRRRDPTRHTCNTSLLIASAAA